MSISLHRISKHYRQEVLTDFSADLPEKGLILLSGPSGCGKTTLLHILLGLIRPDSGEIIGAQGMRFSTVFQEDRLFPGFTIAENINAPLKVPLSPERIEEILSSVGLPGTAGLYPDELSGGMRRRVAFARALAYNGDVFVLDEPFSGLDKGARTLLLNWILQLSKQKSVLLVTHDPIPLQEEAALVIDLKNI